MLCLSEMRRFLQSSSFWEARCALIGQLSGALWLAEYLKRVTEMLRPLPCCDAMSRHDETKTVKPTINEAFVAFSEDIITDYNDSYSLFTRCAMPCKHNTMSAFVIVETPNKHYSILLKTRVWIVSSKFFKYQEAEAPDCPCDVGIAPLIVFTAIHIVGYSPRIRKQSSVKCAAPTRIFALYFSVLYCFSVVNIT